MEKMTSAAAHGGEVVGEELRIGTSSLRGGDHLGGVRFFKSRRSRPEKPFKGGGGGGRRRRNDDLTCGFCCGR